MQLYKHLVNSVNDKKKTRKKQGMFPTKNCTHSGNEEIVSARAGALYVHTDVMRECCVSVCERSK